MDQRCISSATADGVKQELSRPGGLSLAGLTIFFMGIDQSEEFLASLPVDLDDTTDYLWVDVSPAHWIAQDFVAEIAESSEYVHYSLYVDLVTDPI